MNPEYYGDIIAAGSLAAAIQREAAVSGVMLESVLPGVGGPLTTVSSAQILAARGTVRVTVAREERRFGLSFDSSLGNFVWGYGGSSELSDVVRAIAMWQRGTKIVDMRRAFTFLDFPDMSLAYEEGKHVPVAWEALLSRTSEDEPEKYRLLEALGASDRIRGLFPFFSHERLVLAFDGLKKGEGGVEIDPVSVDRYRLELSDGSSTAVEVDIADLANFIESLLDRVSHR